MAAMRSRCAWVSSTEGDFAGCELFCCFCGGELDQFVHLVVLLLVFVEDCRHAELAVLCVGGAGERLFLGEGGDGYVFAEDVLEGMGWLVAGMSAVAFCDMVSTDATMTSSSDAIAVSSSSVISMSASDARCFTCSKVMADMVLP